jgi:hypothetical protein
MKRMIFIGFLTLVMASCASQCCWCKDRNYPQIKVTPQEEWDAYSQVCTLLYNRILSDISYKEEYEEDENRAEYYLWAYDEVVYLFTHQEHAYDGMRDVMDFMDLYLSDFTMDVIAETDEYDDYNRWVYGRYFNGTVRTLHYVCDCVNPRTDIDYTKCKKQGLL